MRSLFTFLFLVGAICSFSQTYRFNPTWKKGEVKLVRSVEVEKEFENDLLIDEITTSNEMRITVLSDKGENYTIEVLFENQALKAALNLYEGLAEELPELRDLKLIFTVHKANAALELVNWKEAQAFMNQSFDDIAAVIQRKMPDEAPFIDLVFMPIRELFRDKESIEAYMSTTIAFILTPFNTDFTLGIANEQLDTAPNPFNPEQQVTTTTRITLESISPTACMFQQEVELDISQFVEMMRTMIKKMTESLNDGQGLSPEKLAEFEEFNMEITNQQTIAFDRTSSWVTQVDGMVTVTGNDPMKGVASRRESILQITIE